MSQCKECGATLPQDSRFCLQCGTENKPSENRPAVPEKDLEFLKPSVTGGLALGVVSALPFIGGLNVICCLWAQAGGGFTAWLLNKQRPGHLKYSDGAFGGVFTGLIGAIVSTIIQIPILMLTLTPERVAQFQTDFERRMQGMQQGGGTIPPQVRDWMLRYLTDVPFRTLFTLIMYMIFFGLFAMIGGIITTAIISRRKLD
jgi:zinc ribbon protein